MRRFETAHLIVEQVAKMYELDPADIFSKNRHKTSSLARAMCCLLIRDLTRMSYPEIGDWLGRRDHTTIMTGHRKALRLMTLDEATHEHHVYRTVFTLISNGCALSVVKCPGVGVELMEVAAQ
jgi:chromosomal replication initiator protein